MPHFHKHQWIQKNCCSG